MITEKRKELIENFDEVMSYFFIDSIGGFIWRANHDASHGRIEMTPELQQALNELHEEQTLCVNQLTKFGVDPESAKDRANGDYWKWYGHWKNWVESMSDEQWNEIDRRMNNEEDITEFLPKIKWNEMPVA